MLLRADLSVPGRVLLQVQAGQLRSRSSKNKCYKEQKTPIRRKIVYVNHFEEYKHDSAKNNPNDVVGLVRFRRARRFVDRAKQD